MQLDDPVVMADDAVHCIFEDATVGKPKVSDQMRESIDRPNII